MYGIITDCGIQDYYIGYVLEIEGNIEGYGVVLNKEDFPSDLICNKCVKPISKEAYDLYKPRNKLLNEYLKEVDS